MHLRISFYLGIEEWKYAVQVFSVLDDPQLLNWLLKPEISLLNFITPKFPPLEGRDVLDS